MFAATSPSDPAPKLQRLDGEAFVSFSGPDNRLDRLHQANPCRILLPRRPGRDVEAVLLNTAGGITDGDRLRYGISADRGATIAATTQAAEKIYRSRDGESRVENSLDVGGGAHLEWLPQETILFDGAALSRRMDIRIDCDSRVLALDWLILGRRASGELLRDARIHDRWRLRRDGKLIWADDFRLSGNIDKRRRGPALLDGAVAVATLIYVANDAETYAGPVKGQLRRCRCRAGASTRPGLIICRFLADDALILRHDVEEFLLAFRTALHERHRPLPRVWAC